MRGKTSTDKTSNMVPKQTASQKSWDGKLAGSSCGMMHS
jgi:hypothetical protein